MRILFSDQEKLAKRGWGFIVAGIINLYFVVLLYNDIGSQGIIEWIMLLMLTFMPFVTVIRGIQLLSRNKNDYIILEDQYISVYRNFFFSRRSITYDKISNCYVGENNIVISLEENEEIAIKLDWLSVEDEKLLKEELVKKTNKDALLRSAYRTRFSLLP